ncbi:MAG: ISKra4 family transposase [Phycisphaerales bacterium]|nr:ISKra4 family transposase [Phycisphaerales bacterium]
MEGSHRPCECGRAQRFVEHRSKTIATMMGDIELNRAYYHCRHCKQSATPYDRRVGLGTGPESVGLAQAAVWLGKQDVFENASATLFRLTGQRLSASTIQRLTESVGGVVARAEEKAVRAMRPDHPREFAAAMRDWKSPPAEASPETLYVLVDGVQVHQDGWHEAKVVVCYWYDKDGHRHNRYAVRFENAAEFVPFVWSLACRCGLEKAKRVVLLGDGAEWIWRHIGGLLKEAVWIVDWYHACEHVWTCGRVLHGENTVETQAWVKEIEGLLWEGQVRAILERLRTALARTRAKTKRTALQALITYIENQDARLAYDKFRAAGLDIGSGSVESACKHLVALRMKRSGMRWSKAGSQNVLSIRAAWLNGEWDAVWNNKPLAAA